MQEHVTGCWQTVSALPTDMRLFIEKNKTALGPVGSGTPVCVSPFWTEISAHNESCLYVRFMAPNLVSVSTIGTMLSLKATSFILVALSNILTNCFLFPPFPPSQVARGASAALHPWSLQWWQGQQSTTGPLTDTTWSSRSGWMEFRESSVGLLRQPPARKWWLLWHRP